MSLRFIYGKSGTGKTTFCFNEISKLLTSGEKKVIMITPEQFSFTAEQNLLKAVGKEAVIHAEVLTFQRMAYRVISEVGEAHKTNLTDAGKAVVLSYILEKSKKTLNYLGNSEKNVEIGSRLITEFKKHSIKQESIDRVLSNLDNRSLQYKLEDIKLLYDEYTKVIEKSFIEEDDVLTILYDNIEKTKIVKDSIIYIDEFAGFTKQEYLVIEKLMKLADEVTISICADNLQEGTNPDTDLFYPNKVVINELIKIAQKNNIRREEDIHLEETHRFQTEELKFLEKSLSSSTLKPYEGSCENIELFLANNLYSEVEQVASQITHLIKQEEYQYHDISVITKEISNYASLIKAIFNKYEIPVFIDEKKELNQNILVKYILALLDIFAKNWSIETVFNYIKTGFLDLEQEEIYLLENYCVNYGIKGIKKYTEEWKIAKEGIDDLEILNELRQKIVLPLLQFRQKLMGRKTVKEISKRVYQFLIENKIDEKVEQKSKELKEKGNIELSNYYAASWNMLVSILDELVLVLGDEKVSFEQYTNLLKVAFNHTSLGKIPATLDEVIVGDVDRSRSAKKKAVFIIGLNDGVFPSNHKVEGLIDDEERLLLKQEGIELAKTLVEQVYDENFNIYKAFTTAEEKLFLSYASSDSEGKALRKSILLHNIRKIFPMLREKSDSEEAKEIGIVNKKVTFDKLLLELRKYFNGEEIDPIWFELYVLFAEDKEYCQKLQEAIQGFEFTNLPEKIKEENLQRLYGNTIQTSISKLEAYSRCPFSYYLQYGLKLSDKTEFKIESLDTGTFMHEVIDTFFLGMQEENRNIRELEEEDIQRRVATIIGEKLKHQKNYIFTSTAKYQFLTNRLKKVITKSLQYILKTIILSNFKVLGNEVEFNTKGQYPPIQIELDNGQKLQIIGKIDRVDIAENEEGKLIRIIDYKSSIKNIDLNEVMAGTQIQLLTYLDAVSKEEKADPAGLLYFHLIEPVIRNKNRYVTDEELEEEIKHHFRMNGYILGDVKVVQMMDHTLKSGKSEMIPAYIDTKGEVSKTRSNSLSSLEFKLLQNQIDKILKQIAKGIVTGNIEPNPVYIEKKKSTPCLYCNYKAICSFNPELEGNCYRYVPNLDKNIILERLKEDKKGKD